ncbi:MAG TPA: DUF6600 domain-containing protein [Thermoanaerobaculia bacterium]|nr:DUF6600 domain-containing protein [Thermoanaerobaculia bacterium]
MRHTKIALFLLLGAVAASRIVHAQPPPDGEGDRRGGDNSSYGNAGDPDQASVQYFHQRLSPYGRWEARAGYGDVWIPRVSSGWRPYTTGHWVYTDQGWAWVANEPWGWAAFHYGRWYHDENSGWGWVPGHVWAPAWVAWRNGGGYLGWAPLPPSIGFTAGVGVSFGGVDIETAISPSYYSFVPERAILDARLSSSFVPFSRNADCFRRSSNITRLTVVNNRVFNQGLNVQRIEQVTGRAVPRVRVGSQSYFRQPPVMVAAARQRGTEKFVGRPAPRAIVATNGNRPQAGRQPATNQAAQGRTTSHGSAPVTAPVDAKRNIHGNANRDRSQAAPKARPAHPQHAVKAEASHQAVMPSHPQHAAHAAVQSKPRQQPPPQAKPQHASGKGQPQRQNKRQQPVPNPQKPPA